MVDRGPFNRWVAKYAPLVAVNAQTRKRHYVYCAVTRGGETLYFMLSKRRHEPTTTLLFTKTLSSNGILEKIVIDKRGADTTGIRGNNKIPKRFGCQVPIGTIPSKYLNIIIGHPSR
ncbi:MAG: DDE-type integrase/transposase/recombinase [Rhodobacteraceae bacterium]|nr:DDE-type integrase/transposase/recombinase [Paracoccaceae bacterium]